MNVVLVFSPGPRRVLEWTVELPDLATVYMGLARLKSLVQIASPEDLSFPEQSLTLSVWGRKASPDQPLRAGDRLEWLRGLRVDPKLARRERFQRQGARNAGLFARRRVGGKAGY